MRCSVYSNNLTDASSCIHLILLVIIHMFFYSINYTFEDVNVLALGLCNCRINLKVNEKVNAIDFCLDDERWRICENLVHSHLQQGLSDRAKLIRVTWRSTPPKWNIEDVCCLLAVDLMPHNV